MMIGYASTVLLTSNLCIASQSQQLQTWLNLAEFDLLAENSSATLAESGFARTWLQLSELQPKLAEKAFSYVKPFLAQLSGSGWIWLSLVENGWFWAECWLKIVILAEDRPFLAILSQFLPEDWEGARIYPELVFKCCSESEFRSKTHPKVYKGCWESQFRRCLLRSALSWHTLCGLLIAFSLPNKEDKLFIRRRPKGDGGKGTANKTPQLFTTVYDNLRHFMTISVTLLHWQKTS